MRILLTGSAGRLGRQVAEQLALSHEVVGIDRRPFLGLPPGVVHHRVDLRRRSAEQVFRDFRPEAIVHMGVVHNFRIPPGRLHDRNVVGTETLLRWAVKYKASKVILLSSGDVYGAGPNNSQFLDEDAPLLASVRFPEIRTLVAVDRTVQSFFWRHPQIETVLLRPAHIVGPNVRNAPSNYFRLRILPTQMGFDPMVQLISEKRIIDIVEAALAPGVRGVFNLASTSPVPLSRILAMLKKPTLPVPHPLFRIGLKALWRWRLTTFPPPELDHIRFHTVLDTRRSATFFPRVPEEPLASLLHPFMAPPAK